MFDNYLRTKEAQGFYSHFIKEDLIDIINHALPTVNIYTIDYELLNKAISLLMEIDHGERKSLLLKCIASLKVTLAVIKENKTPEDWETIRKGADTYINLSSANLENANLRGAALSDANLSNANLRNANLRNADLSNAKLQSSILNNALLHNTNLNNANLSYCHFSDTTINNTFVKTNLSGIDMRDIDWHFLKLRVGKDFFVVDKARLHSTIWLTRFPLTTSNPNLKPVIEWLLARLNEWNDRNSGNKSEHDFRTAITLH